ncbi:MAG TPA: DNA repair exonuclease [Ignavibacteriales bacterium]|nr:DNA repair exonuclease [Ignavibacteriales bacterium]
MSVKIFHTADIHIGLKFSGRDYPQDLKDRLVAEPLETLKRMVRLANENKCDLFVIAGDMFDRTNISKAEVRKAALALNEFQGTSVCVLPGNHDFIEDDPESIWAAFREKMSEHLLLFLDKPEPKSVTAGERKVTFYPGACRTKHSNENAIGWVKDAPKSRDDLNIGVAHGSVQGVSPDMEQNYFPMTPDEMRQSGVSFWLLGHTHVQYPKSRGTMNPVFFMPSTPCPDGFDCMHEGYAWIIEVMEDNSLKYEPVRTGTFTFKTWEKEVYSITDVEKLKSEALTLPKETTLMKLKLKGRLNSSELETLPDLLNEIKNSLIYIESDTQDVILNIDKDYIEKSFSEDSLPYRLLGRIEKCGDELALQLAFSLIEEARK